MREAETALKKPGESHEPSERDGAPPLWQRYVFAAVCVLAAFGIRYWLAPILGEELPFLMFIAAALLAAWYGGAVTGVVALMLGLFLADYFFLRGKEGSRPLEFVRLLRYLFTASLGIVLIEVLHRGRRRTQAVVEELWREVERRKRSEAELLEAKGELSRHAEQLERRVAERTTELADTVEALKGLLHHIAHNLRAPLRAMSGYTTLLLSEYAAQLDATAQEYSRHISDAAARMDQLIQDLLAYGRLGHIEIPLTAVNLNKVLERVLFLLAYQIQARKAEVNVLSPLPEVRANAEVLETVLTNLLENAIEFVAPGVVPRVRIWAELRGSRVRLWISDNGIGIDPRFHERIFGAFETLDSAGRAGATGIGLAIVKQGVQRMGGDVGVESQLNAGSRFWLEFAAAPGPLTADGGV